MAKGACTLVVKQHSAEVTSAVWLPEGDRIITGSHDKNMVLHSSQCRACAVTCCGGPPIEHRRDCMLSVTVNWNWAGVEPC